MPETGLKDIVATFTKDGMSPMLQVVWHPPEPGEGVELAKERGKTKAAITHCTLCPLHKSRTQSVPYSGPSNAKFAVLGEGPGPTEDTQGKPFVGKSGKLLRALLSQLGVDPDTTFFFNGVSCFPTDGGRKIRTPTDYELHRCRPHLEAQRQAAHTQFILLAGGTALSTFRSDLRISKVHGQVFIWDAKWVVMPIYHPSAALRGNRDIKEAIRFDLEMFMHMVEGELDPRDLFRYTCVRCHEPVTNFDSNAVGYCTKHWEDWKDEWSNQRKRWKGPAPKQSSVATQASTAPASGPIEGAISIAKPARKKARKGGRSGQSEQLF